MLYARPPSHKDNNDELANQHHEATRIPPITKHANLQFDPVPILVSLLVHRSELAPVLPTGISAPYQSVDEFLLSSASRIVGIGDSAVFRASRGPGGKTGGPLTVTGFAQHFQETHALAGIGGSASMYAFRHVAGEMAQIGLGRDAAREVLSQGVHGAARDVTYSHYSCGVLLLPVVQLMLGELPAQEQKEVDHKLALAGHPQRVAMSAAVQLVALQLEANMGPVALAGNVEDFRRWKRGHLSGEYSLENEEVETAIAEDDEGASVLEQIAAAKDKLERLNSLAYKGAVAMCSGHCLRSNRKKGREAGSGVPYLSSPFAFGSCCTSLLLTGKCSQVAGESVRNWRA